MNDTINDETVAFNNTVDTPVVKFLISLSDGRTVIQDNRTGQQHAWTRLGNWLADNKHIKMTEARLQGPGGVDIKMPSNQNGYFFGQKQHAVWNGPQYNYIGVGYYDGQKINVSWYRQPEFDHSFAEDRTIQNAGFFFIKNN